MTIRHSAWHGRTSKRNIIRHVSLVMLFTCCSVCKSENLCYYISKQDEGFSGHDDCGVITGDNVDLQRDHLDNLRYDSNGLSCVLFPDGDAFYISETGRSHRVYFFDNGCDYFRQGLTRGIVDGRMVVVNRDLEVVSSTGFDFIMPHDCGYSIACNGPFEIESYGEHRLMRGGTCGLLDRKGDLVMEPEYRIEERMEFDSFIEHTGHCPTLPTRKLDR